MLCGINCDSLITSLMIEHYINYLAEIWWMLGSAIIVTAVKIKYLEYFSQKILDFYEIQPDNDPTSRNHVLYAFAPVVNQGKPVSLFFMNIRVYLNFTV